MMKLKIALLGLLAILMVVPLFAQVRAVTEHGDTIFVYDNGTWSFTDDADEAGSFAGELEFLEEELVIDTITTPFKVHQSANKEAVSKIGLYKLKYDPAKWKRVPPGDLNAEAEMAFVFKGKDIYSLIVSEEIEIGKENIFKIAMNNIKENIGGKVEIVKVEQRVVNGKEILRGVYKVEVSGLNMIFDSYYYSNAKGTLQFSTWTGLNLWEKQQETISNFLNGLIILDTEN